MRKFILPRPREGRVADVTRASTDAQRICISAGGDGAGRRNRRRPCQAAYHTGSSCTATPCPPDRAPRARAVLVSLCSLPLPFWTLALITLKVVVAAFIARGEFSANSGDRLDERTPLLLQFYPPASSIRSNLCQEGLTSAARLHKSHRSRRRRDPSLSL